MQSSQNMRELKQDLLGAYLCHLLPPESPETGWRGPQCNIDSQSLILSSEGLEVSQFCLSLSHVTVARYLHISSIVQIPRHRQISQRWWLGLTQPSQRKTNKSQKLLYWKLQRFPRAVNTRRHTIQKCVFLHSWSPLRSEFLKDNSHERWGRIRNF